MAANESMKGPTISVAMATYNGKRFLREHLDSFARQTLLPDELVVTDDGSTDRTLEILQNFQRTAPFEVRVYRNNNRLGFSKNFENAMSLCSGSVIFLSDQDDAWFPNKINRVLPLFTCDPRIMVVINDHILTDEGLSHHNESVLQKLASIGRGYSDFFPGCCTAMRREWVDLALPVPAEGIWGYDLWINALADLLGVRLVLAEPLQFYRRHASNTAYWFLSSAQKPSLYGAFRHYGLQDARPGWLNEANRKKLYHQRLADRADQLRSLQLEAARDRAMTRLSGEIRTIEKRIALMNLPRGLRAPAVAKFLMEGGYTHFSGWESALKDALR